MYVYIYVYMLPSPNPKHSKESLSQILNPRRSTAVYRVGQKVSEVVVSNDCEEYAAQFSTSLDRDTQIAVCLSSLEFADRRHEFQ